MLKNKTLAALLMSIALLTSVFSPNCLGQMATSRFTPAPTQTASGKAVVERLKAILPRLEQANEEAKKAATTCAMKLYEFIKERQEGKVMFADDVMGLGGKMAIGSELAGVLANGLGELFGQKSSAAKPDDVRLFIRGSFAKHILTHEDLRKAVIEVAAGYARELQEIEARLLVDLKLDLDCIRLPNNFDEFAIEALPIGNDATLLRPLFEVLTRGAAADMGKFFASAIIGDAITNQVVEKGASKAKRFGADFAIGLAVDKALDAGVEAAGFRPDQEVQKIVVAWMESLYRSICVGTSKDMQKAHAWLTQHSQIHPDADVREACLKAKKALESSRQIGLVYRMFAMASEQRTIRDRAIFAFYFGENLPPQLKIGGADRKDLPSRDEMFQVVNSLMKGAR